MGYHQFKKVWLSLVDVRAELRGRHEPFNRFLPTSVLAKKLAALVDAEEKQEAKTLLEAANSLDDERIARERRALVDDAQLLARVVLGEALDAAGHVYVFGKGPFGCFDGEPVTPDFADFMDYARVKDLWTARVRPRAGGSTRDEPGSPETENDSVTTTPTAGSVTFPLTAAQTPLESRSRVAVAAAARAFADRQVSLTTAFLWAKRVRSIACGAVVAYAVTDAGELFCWGGKQRTWRSFYDQSTLDNRPEAVVVGQLSLSQDPSRPLTTRSEMLKLSLPSQAANNQRRHDTSLVRNRYARTFVKPEHALPTLDDERARLLLVGRYYDLLPPTTNDPSSRTPAPLSSSSAPLPGALPTAPLLSLPPLSLQELVETVEPELNVDDLVLSLQMRGVYLAKPTRVELLAKLADCLALEIECVDDAFHRHMKAQDTVARRLRHERRENAVIHVAGKTAALWCELAILQRNIVAAESDAFRHNEQEYREMKRRILATKQRLKRQAREGLDAPPAQPDDAPTPLLLHANGLTARGAPLQDFDGRHAVECVAIGSRHALAVRQSGELLTWGVGSFGRLGGAHDAQSSLSSRDCTWDPNDPTAWHSDVHAPATVDAVAQHRFRAVACGFGHSLALSSRGQVFVWGSATDGKLGIGPVDARESFTLAPMLLVLPTGVLVRKIACGPSHSALLTTDGHLYVWGSGDGGKLGLGDGRDVGQDRVPRNSGKLGVVSMPTRVLAPFADERLVEVSCGTGHTVVLTATATHQQQAGDSVSDTRLLDGGRVFVAGSNHALATFTPTFTALAITTSANDHVSMTRVSCGNAHTAVVSADGELFTWGSNVGGCTGHAVLLSRIPTPTRVDCMYQRPRNLCLLNGVRAVQSTQNASCQPDYALVRMSLLSTQYAQTQHETCPFWQVTLQQMSRIECVRVAVVASTGPTSDSNDSTHRPVSSSGLRVKYAVLISQFPFDTDERGKYALALAKSHSTHVGFTLSGPSQAEYVWTLPLDTFGQYVRVQLDNASGMLGLRAVEVVGMDATAYTGPKVGDVSCGEAITAVVCRPLSSVEALCERFVRAVRADSANLAVLQQIESFHPFLNGVDALVGNRRQGNACVLCRPKETCVVCLVEQAIVSDGRVDAVKRMAATTVNAGDTVAATTAAFVRTREKEEEKRAALRGLTLDELCRQLLTMNMRTEEEEAAQQEQLEQELRDLNVLAVGDKNQPTDGVVVSRDTVQGAGAGGGSAGRNVGGDVGTSGLLAKLKRVFGRKAVAANPKVVAGD